MSRLMREGPEYRRCNHVCFGLKADIAARLSDIRYPQKRTLIECARMAALGAKSGLIYGSNRRQGSTCSYAISTCRSRPERRTVKALLSVLVLEKQPLSSKWRGPCRGVTQRVLC